MDYWVILLCFVVAQGRLRGQNQNPTTTLSTMAMFLLLLTSLALCQAQRSPDAPTSTVCIIGSGSGGSSVAHFLRQYSPNSTPAIDIHVFERKGIPGGRMATVTVAGETFEAGGSILHPKNWHAVNYTKLLNLKVKKPSSESLSLGIWNGKKFVFKTIKMNSKIPFFDKMASLANSVLMFFRYGLSLLKMESFVEVFRLFFISSICSLVLYVIVFFFLIVLWFRLPWTAS